MLAGLKVGSHENEGCELLIPLSAWASFHFGIFYFYHTICGAFAPYHFISGTIHPQSF